MILRPYDDKLSQVDGVASMAICRYGNNGTLTCEHIGEPGVELYLVTGYYPRNIRVAPSHIEYYIANEHGWIPLWLCAAGGGHEDTWTMPKRLGVYQPSLCRADYDLAVKYAIEYAFRLV